MHVCHLWGLEEGRDLVWGSSLKTNGGQYDALFLLFWGPLLHQGNNAIRHMHEATVSMETSPKCITWWRRFSPQSKKQYKWDYTLWTGGQLLGLGQLCFYFCLFAHYSYILFSKMFLSCILPIRISRPTKGKQLSEMKQLFESALLSIALCINFSLSICSQGSIQDFLLGGEHIYRMCRNWCINIYCTKHCIIIQCCGNTTKKLGGN